jgi:hypothetical protein
MDEDRGGREELWHQRFDPHASSSIVSVTNSPNHDSTVYASVKSLSEATTRQSTAACK